MPEILYMKPVSRKQYAIVLILLLAAAIRLGVLVTSSYHPEGRYTPDSEEYVQLAQNLCESNRFELKPDSPEVFRTPGYPFFLAVGKSLFGMTGTLWLQVLIDLGLIYLTYLLGAYLMNPNVGLWAAGFQAVSDIAIVSSLRFLSDGIFAFLLTATILLLVHHFRNGRWASLLAAAICTGLACYVRPVGLMFAGLVTLMLLFQGKRFRRAGAFVGLVAILVFPWIIRNSCLTGYNGFSSFASDSMYKYSAPLTLANAEGYSIDQARKNLSDRFRTICPDETAKEYSPRYARLRQKIALKTIADHPMAYAKIHLRGTAAFWLPGITDVLELLGITTGQRGTLSVLHEKGLWSAIRYYLDGEIWALWLCIPAVLVLLAKYALAATTAIHSLRWNKSAAAWLILGTILAFWLIGGPATTPRFRVPIAPLLSVVAAVGIDLFMRRSHCPSQDEISPTA
jgi:4-amino-4-deoxy-L-arabinose transferase-like glycosyltransferase